MTPPPPPGDYPPTGVRRATQPAAPQAPDIPAWVRDKLGEGERAFGTLNASHQALAARVNEALVTIRDDITGIREQMAEERKERRRRDGEVRDDIQDADERLYQLAEGQAAQGAELRALRDGQGRQGEQLAQVVAGQAKQGDQLAQILEAVAAAKAVAADRAAQGQGGAGISPDGGALVPLHQPRSKVALGAAGVTTVALTVVGALANLPPVLQWALAIALVVVVAGGTVVGVRLMTGRR